MILDANERIGDSWRKRWDSLRLFTPAKFDSLAGMRFPAPRNSFPTKDEMADYLEAYAARFSLPVRSGVRVERLFKRGARYVVKAGRARAGSRSSGGGDGELSAPEACPLLRLRSLPRSFRCTRTTIATWPSSSRAASSSSAPATREPSSRWRSCAAVIRHGSRAGTPARAISTGGILRAQPARRRLLLRFVFHRLLTVRTPLGRKARPKVLAKGSAADPGQAEGSRGGWHPARPARRRRAATAGRCSKMAGCWTWPTSSGAAAFIPASTG